MKQPRQHPINTLTTRSFSLACHLVTSGIELLDAQAQDASLREAVFTFPVSARPLMTRYYAERDRLNAALEASLTAPTTSEEAHVQA